MTGNTKRLVLMALGYLRGDDLERAEAAFRGLTSDQMKQPYGQSGMSRQEILDGYRMHVAGVKEAITEVESL